MLSPKECLAFWYANAWPSAGIWFISAQGLSRPEYHTAGPVYLCTISLSQEAGLSESAIHAAHAVWPGWINPSHEHLSINIIPVEYIYASCFHIHPYNALSAQISRLLGEDGSNLKLHWITPRPGNQIFFSGRYFRGISARGVTPEHHNAPSCYRDTIAMNLWCKAG